MGPADWEPRPGDSYAFNDQARQKKKEREKRKTKAATQQTLYPFLLTCLKVNSGDKLLP